MTDKLFLDTAVFIYFLENNSYYADKVEHFLYEEIKNKSQSFTSTITIMEFCSKPFELGKIDLIDKFNSFLLDLNVKVIPITEDIAINAAKLRSRFKSLKAMDSLQLSSSINFGCDRFISNDIKLQQIKDIKVELVVDF